MCTTAKKINKWIITWGCEEGRCVRVCGLKREGGGGHFRCFNGRTDFLCNNMKMTRRSRRVSVMTTGEGACLMSHCGPDWEEHTRTHKKKKTGLKTQMEVRWGWVGRVEGWRREDMAWGKNQLRAGWEGSRAQARSEASERVCVRACMCVHVRCAPIHKTPRTHGRKKGTKDFETDTKH